MGLRSALRLSSAARDLGAHAPMALASPWGTGDLSTIVWADLVDTDALPITRAEAMAVPAVARARHLIAGAVAACPLAVYRGATRLPDPEQPAWTYRTDGDVSPWHRLLWTVDDHLFTGWSLWAVTRGTDGQVLTASRVPRDAWSFASDGTVLWGDRPAPADRVILLPGPHEGILTYAARTIRAASRLERSAARHANNPVPSVELRQTVDVELSTAERDELIAQWVAARTSDGGAVGFTSYGIEAHPLGQVPEQLLVDGRNAAAVDVARHTSIPAAMLDATTAGASLTYETTQGRQGQFLDWGVRLYVDAIAARLSMDDVVPRGQRTAVETDALTALVPDSDSAPLD